MGKRGITATNSQASLLFICILSKNHLWEDSKVFAFRLALRDVDSARNKLPDRKEEGERENESEWVIFVRVKVIVSVSVSFWVSVRVRVDGSREV